MARPERAGAGQTPELLLLQVALMFFRLYLKSLIEHDAGHRTYCALELREVSCKQSEVGNVPEQDAINDLLRGRALSVRSGTWLARSLLALHEACVRLPFS